MAQLDADAPAAAGHPALPLRDQPSPMAERPPHGLYAAEPTPDTLSRLSTGTLSPDLRFRVAMSGPDAWVARVDGAWFWQIQVPPPPPPQPAEPATPTAGPVPSPPPPAPAPTVRSPLQWTPQSSLLFQDSNGTWQEANPAMAQVVALPAALQGSSEVLFSPDGRQVLFRKGNQLLTANRDGSLPKLVGQNLTGFWAPDSTLITTTAPVPGTGTSTDPRIPGMGMQ